MKLRVGAFVSMFAIVLVGMTMMSNVAYAQYSKTSEDVVTTLDLTSADIEVPAQAGMKFGRQQGDDIPSPQSIEQNALRQEALKQRLAGKGSGKIHQVASGQYVELQLEKTDHIFAIIVEYGDKGGVATPALSQSPGPLHNQIPEPNRAVDNNTIWSPDYSKAHFEQLYSTQMADYYKTQSSGRYTVNGTVTEWVKVPFNGPRYGANAMGDAGAWTLIADAINTWTQAQLASGKTIDEVKAYLQQFDQWDRYDYDKDGDFNEPDGYIDHFQIIHSGEGEETGGGALGADAIWSHRWFAFYNWRGTAGPSYNKYGGIEFGGGWGANPDGTTAGSSGASVGAGRANVTNAYPVTPTGIFVGDYTIQPENGGLGVFAHEFGHDLGLPDHYDTASGGTNGNAFWNIMANGSYLGDGTVDIGSKPGDMMAWDKLQLGWLNYEVAYAGKFSSHKLGPAETNTKQAQGLVVVLPPNKNVFYMYNPATATGLPFGNAYWGGNGDLIDTSMTRQIAVPAGTPVMTMQVSYQIESNWDYAYVMASADNGATWTFLQGTYVNSSGSKVPITTCTNPNNSSAFLGCGITGSTSLAWRLASFDMSAFAGQNILLRFRYKTDEYTNLKGFLVDQITLGSVTDGADDSSAWTIAGFKVSNGIEASNQPHYYIAEYRQYRTYDEGLKTGPYTFGYADMPEMVAHYPYQDGMLVTYWDTDTSNDNISQHPGEGRCLPVDAHPDPLIRTGTWPNQTTFASPWGAAVQMYDATFGLEPTDALNLPFYGTYSGQRLQFWQAHPSLAAATEFNDTKTYWFPLTQASGVIVPKTGTIIRVVNTSTQGDFMQVHVDSVK